MYIIKDETSKDSDYIAEAINTVTFQKIFIKAWQGTGKYEVCITVPYLRDPGLNTVRVAFCDTEKKAFNHLKERIYMGWASYQDDNLDARGEAAPINVAARVSQKRKKNGGSQRSKKSTEKAVRWIQDKDHNWWLLDDLPVNAPYMDCYAVYIIWYFDENDVPVVVRTGIKNPKDHLIIMHNISKVKKYADHGLCITWAKTESSDLERIWAYLFEKLKPLESPHCWWRDDPLSINLPK